jgi:bifunctional DNA-binding transcriptional regulator/antitoxin component of YhaV-PrlF toxin-antitoxin module
MNPFITFPQNARPEPTFTLEDISVIQRGQITIHKDERDTHNLTHGDYVDLLVLTENGASISVTDAQIVESGRVTLPKKTRTRYNITPGDTVTVHVFIE